MNQNFLNLEEQISGIESDPTIIFRRDRQFLLLEKTCL